jgi:hypothetical protein
MMMRQSVMAGHDGGERVDKKAKTPKKPKTAKPKGSTKTA